MRCVDLNCDLGEGGPHDAALMPLVTSANIACGGHAGDETTMKASIALALQHGTAIGAHPGIADRENFGRLERPLTGDEVRELVAVQTERLQRLAEAAGGMLTHVKPHGALYTMAARDPAVAAAVAVAVYEVDSRLVLVGLAGSHLVEAGLAGGLRVMQEAFADRTYQADGSLTPRRRPDALITDEARAVAQVLRMVTEGRVTATDGSDVEIRAETICLHGDGTRPVEFAQELRRALAAAGVEVGVHRP
jgi:UPF0271 protein